MCKSEFEYTELRDESAEERQVQVRRPKAIAGPYISKVA